MVCIFCCTLHNNYYRIIPGRGKPVLIMHIGFFACFHAISISRTQSFQQNRHIVFLALVALKLLVSLISRLVGCSARIVVDRQTYTQNDYCNRRCVCAPRVNNHITCIFTQIMLQTGGFPMKCECIA